MVQALAAMAGKGPVHLYADDEGATLVELAALSAAALNSTLHNAQATAATVCYNGLFGAYTAMVEHFHANVVEGTSASQATAEARRLTEAGGGGGGFTAEHLAALVAASDVRHPNIAQTLLRPGAFGCTNAAASNFDEAAVADDGSCDVPGCTNASLGSFDPRATRDDGSCL